MENTHGVPTPMYSNEKFDLAKESGEKALDDKGVDVSQAIIGSLIYIAVATRPDI
jgi:hypothetical protein